MRFWICQADAVSGETTTSAKAWKAVGSNPIKACQLMGIGDDQLPPRAEVTRLVL
jgi:hypothetical protein